MLYAYNTALQHVNANRIDHTHKAAKNNATEVEMHCECLFLHNVTSVFLAQVRITPGAHNTEDQINKQLADKERVAAALENPYLLEVVDRCLEPPE